MLSPASIQDRLPLKIENAVTEWKLVSGIEPPVEKLQHLQKSWDQPIVQKIFSNLLQEFANDKLETARLSGVCNNLSGLWLNALPSSNLGQLLDNNCITSSIALRLGGSIFKTHTCQCNSLVDEKGHHGLRCKFSKGRFERHRNLNDIIKRSLGSAGFSSKLEPSGLIRDDGKRPDGMTLSPWSRGKALVWDVTVVDPLCTTYLNSSVIEPFSASKNAELKKRSKYQNLSDNFLFIPIGFDVLGGFGPEAKSIINTIGKEIFKRTGEIKSTLFLKEKISIEIQRSNSTCMYGTLEKPDYFPEINYIV
jgi:hypothetical protein